MQKKSYLLHKKLEIFRIKVSKYKHINRLYYFITFVLQTALKISLNFIEKSQYTVMFE